MGVVFIQARTVTILNRVRSAGINKTAMLQIYKLFKQGELISSLIGLPYF